MRKLSLLTILIFAVIITACSGVMPSPNGAESEQPPTSLSNPSSGDGATTRQEVQRLFGTLLTAFRTADAALLRSTMTRDLALLCPEDSMEPWLLENGPRIQAFELASVFIDAEDPDRGMAQLALLPERDEAKPLQVESASWFPLSLSPFRYKERREIGRQGIRYRRSTRIVPTNCINSFRPNRESDPTTRIYLDSTSTCGTPLSGARNRTAQAAPATRASTTKGTRPECPPYGPPPSKRRI